MNSNLKESAAKISGLTGLGGTASFLRNEIVSDSLRNMNSITSVSQLLGNLGQADLASNYIIEQRQLLNLLANENKFVRDLVNDKVSAPPSFYF
jgi:hypothetical protein